MTLPEIQAALAAAKKQRLTPAMTTLVAATETYVKLLEAQATLTHFERLIESASQLQEDCHGVSGIADRDRQLQALYAIGASIVFQLEKLNKRPT